MANKNEYTLRNIHTQESEPCLSAFDPYEPTAFGSIAFIVNDHHVYIPTYDRCTDDVYVDGYQYHLVLDESKEIDAFIQSIWYKEWTETPIPECLADMISNIIIC